MKTCLIVTGGRMDIPFAGSFLKGKKFDEVIAADSGLASLNALGLAPDLVVGDLDSVPREVLERMRGRDGLDWDIHRPEKDETDTELAILKALEAGCTHLTLLGATGGRLDHFLGNLHLLCPCLKKGVHAEIVDRCNRIYLLDGRREFEEGRLHGPFVSFLPLTETVEGITLKGFKYPLTDKTIHIGTSLCISNELVAGTAEITFRRGVLICVESRDGELA